jgi:hypothetical protein
MTDNPQTTTLTQRVREAGFDIATKTETDRIGICHAVTVTRGGKKTTRRGRKYEDALTRCAEARGIANGQ